MSEDRTVIVVGDGPSALAAAAMLHGSGREVTLVRAGREATRPGPVYLTARALRELSSLGLGPPPGRRLSRTSVVTADGCSAMSLLDASLVLDHSVWARHLDRELDALDLTRVDGRAVTLDAMAGSVEVATSGGLVSLSADRVVWATGERPAGWTTSASTPLAVSLQPASLDLSTDSLRLVPPTALAGGWTARWGVSHDGVAWEGTLRQVEASSQDLATDEVAVDWSFSAGRIARGRVLLVGGSAGLLNPMTGEGISYALSSGAMAARAVLQRGLTDRLFVAEMSVRFGSQPSPDGESTRRVRLAARAVDSALRDRSPVRDRVVGIMLDHGADLPGIPLLSDLDPRPADDDRARAVRAQVARLCANEVMEAWRSAAPSLVEIPQLADLRLSDLLVAATDDRHADPAVVARMGAAIDLAAASATFLSASVSDRTDAADRRSWVEIAGVTSHDLMAASALRLAALSGAEPAEAFVAWLGAAATTRQHAITSPAGSVEDLATVIFEFPCRLAAALCADSSADLTRWTDVGRLLGRAFLLGEELAYARGGRGRLGLTADGARSRALRIAGPVPTQEAVLHEAETVRADVEAALAAIVRLSPAARRTFGWVLDACLGTALRAPRESVLA